MQCIKLKCKRIKKASLKNDAFSFNQNQINLTKLIYFKILYSIGACFLRLKTQNIIGKTNNVKMVAVIKPPMITIANGFCDSEPIPVEIAAGNSPIEAIRAVITTALVLAFTPVKIDSSRLNFALIL